MSRMEEKLGLVAQAYIVLATRKVETGGSQVQGLPGL